MLCIADPAQDNGAEKEVGQKSDGEIEKSLRPYS